MKKMSCRNMFFLLLFICLAGLSGSIAYLFFSLASAAQASYAVKGHALPTATLAVNPTVPALTQKVCKGAKQPNFERGVVFPRWSNHAYGGDDRDWLTELPQMQTQTAACWVEMPVEFQQATLLSTDLSVGKNTPSLDAFVYGLHFAHAQGLHIFVTLLVTIPTGIEHWVGAVQLPTLAQQQAWFTSYWKTVQPYVLAAQQAGVEQLAMGTEIQWLQDNAPASLWNNLIAQFHSVFKGNLTYDINWNALKKPTLPWMKNPSLKMIGISAYVPVTKAAKRIDPQQIPALWGSTVKVLLDKYSTELGAPVFISEVGYRNTADALYLPWQPKSSATVDLLEQQGACGAVLQNVLNDPHILGSFFWAWDGAENLNLKNSPAAQTIGHYYQTL